jgi:hypothetical protein
MLYCVKYLAPVATQAFNEHDIIWLVTYISENHGATVADHISGTENSYPNSDQ